MKALFAHWLAPQVRTEAGLLWCAAWFGFVALLLFGFGVFDGGPARTMFLFAIGALHAYAALGLLRGLKPGWHIAAFLAFAMMITRIIAISCAPGEIARGDSNLFHASSDVLLLTIAIVIFAYLRKPEIRRLYGVPESYRTAE